MKNLILLASILILAACSNENGSAIESANAAEKAVAAAPVVVAAAEGTGTSEAPAGMGGMAGGERAGMGDRAGMAGGMAGAPAAAQTLADAPAGDYTIDKTHGYITFTYNHQGYSTPFLRWRDWDSTVTLDPANPSNSSVSVTIDASKVDSGVDSWDEHLVGERFFDVANHPTITFASTTLNLDAEGNGTMVGDLTIKGQTKPVTLDVTFNKSGLNRRGGGQILGFSGRGEVMRSDWGLDVAVPFVSDEVQIIIEAEYNKPAS